MTDDKDPLKVADQRKAPPELTVKKIRKAAIVAIAFVGVGYIMVVSQARKKRVEAAEMNSADATKGKLHEQNPDEIAAHIRDSKNWQNEFALAPGPTKAPSNLPPMGGHRYPAGANVPPAAAAQEPLMLDEQSRPHYTHRENGGGGEGFVSPRDKAAAEARRQALLAEQESSVALSYRRNARQQADPSLAGARGGNRGQRAAGQGLQGLNLPPEIQEMLARGAAGSPGAGLPSMPGMPGAGDPDQMAETMAAMQEDIARRTQALMPALAAAGVGGGGGGQQPYKRRPEINTNRWSGREYLLREGAVLDTVLENRLNGEFSGPVTCMITHPIYSHDRVHVLIPEGSRVLGEVKKVEHQGDTRLAVSFHRIVMPDQFSVDLDQFTGLDQVGETALRDKVNTHFWSTFGKSIAIGLIGGLSQGTSQLNTYGSGRTPLDVYKLGVASSMGQQAQQAFGDLLNHLPELTIKEGTRVGIYVLQDMKLPAYENHDMPSDL